MAYSLDGTNDYLVQGSDFGEPTVTGGFTFSIWIKTTDNTAQRVFGCDAGSTNPDGASHNFTINYSAVPSIAADVEGDCWYYHRSNSVHPLDGEIRLSTGLCDGAWHHLCIASSGSGDTYTTHTAYFDGSLQTFYYRVADGWPNGFNLHHPLALGDRNTSGTGLEGTLRFNGQIAEAAWWNYELNSTEVAALANGVPANYVRNGNLWQYYPLNLQHGPQSHRACNQNTNHLSVTGAELTADHPPVWTPSTQILTASPSPIAVTSVSSDDTVPDNESPWNIAGRGFGAR